MAFVEGAVHPGEWNRTTTVLREQVRDVHERGRVLVKQFARITAPPCESRCAGPLACDDDGLLLRAIELSSAFSARKRVSRLSGAPANQGIGLWSHIVQHRSDESPMKQPPGR